MRKILVCFLITFSIIPAKGDVLTHAKYSFIDAFDWEGLTILAVGAGATAIAFNNDLPMHDAWVNHQRMSEGTARVGDLWGMGIAQSLIVVGQLIFDTEPGITHMESLLTSTAVGFALKYSVKRGRPESENNQSFPSGHTQIAFSSATNILVNYGWLASLPHYAMATLTGLSRMADNAHWLSDVVAGATIGVLFGRASYKHHFEVSPFSEFNGNRAYGLQISYSF